MNIRQQLKKLFKLDITIKIVARLIRVALSLLYLTMRCKMVGNQDLAGREGSFILSFWHGRLLMMPNVAGKGHRVSVLVSFHADGRLIAEVQKCYNFKVIYGSSSKGGLSALRQIFRVVKNGEILAITPDGPRGPARKIGGEIIEIAKILDIPIIPVTFACDRFFKVNSWDKLLVPKPFAKGIFIFGEPKKYASNEELEQALNQITDEADIAVKNL